MEEIAKFEKVSFERYKKDIEAICADGEVCTSNDAIADMYNRIRLPQRATSGSAGYDFFLPFDFTGYLDSKYVFPTGIRCNIKKGWMLSLYPRSSLGFKCGMKLSNTIGIIDSDYYDAPNEGHIILSVVTGSEKHFPGNDELADGTKVVIVREGMAICQGIFTEFGITKDDNPVTHGRNGGLGSTNN